MANKPYSVCSLVRRTMKLRGATRHSGRGFYEMEHDVPSASELFQRLEAAIKEWKDRNVVTAVSRHPDHTTVVLSAELTADGYYTTVRVTKHADLVVGM